MYNRIIAILQAYCTPILLQQNICSINILSLKVRRISLSRVFNLVICCIMGRRLAMSLVKKTTAFLILDAIL